MKRARPHGSKLDREVQLRIKATLGRKGALSVEKGFDELWHSLVEFEDTGPLVLDAGVLRTHCQSAFPKSATPLEDAAAEFVKDLCRKPANDAERALRMIAIAELAEETHSFMEDFHDKLTTKMEAEHDEDKARALDARCDRIASVCRSFCKQVMEPLDGIRNVPESGAIVVAGFPSADFEHAYSEEDEPEGSDESL